MLDQEAGVVGEPRDGANKAWVFYKICIDSQNRKNSEYMHMRTKAREVESSAFARRCRRLSFFIQYRAL